MGKKPEDGSICLALNCSTGEEINRFFEKLSEGGKVLQPLGKQFWGATFGMVQDKYGNFWMLNYQEVDYMQQLKEKQAAAN
ncbi:MAG TPA: VOC family protein [Chitinophagaceae bacterium]|nr:VOC family protein [Chitinophagaceae bacterium]